MNANNLSFSNRVFGSLKKLFLSSLVLAAASAPAAILTWDPLGNNGGPGSGNWDTTASNTNWWNGTFDTNWSQINTTTSTNAAIFGGPSGAYFVTNDAVQVSVSNMYVNASGYTFDGPDALDIYSGTAMYLTNNATVTFNCPMSTVNNVKYFVCTNGSTVIFNGTMGGGQYKFCSPANNSYLINANASVGVWSFNAPAYFSGPWTMTAGASFFIGYPSTVNGVSYGPGSLTVGGGATITQNHSGGSFLAGRGGSQGTLTLTNGGAINVGTVSLASPPNMTLVTEGTANEAGILNIYGGTFTAGYNGAASTASPILLHQNGAGNSSLSVFNQTGGVVYAWCGIAMGSATVTSYSGGSSFITNSGGTLYLGANGILLQTHYPPTNACVFSGGVVGALASWSSRMPITLATNAGTPNITFQCADNNNSPWNISLSGALTGPGGLNVTGGGTLTLSGANDYTGSTVVSNGTLALTTILAGSTNGGSVLVDGSAGTPAFGVLASPGQSVTTGPIAFQNQSTTITLSNSFGALPPSASVAPLQVAGGVDFAATPTVTVYGAAISVGTYPLIQCTSGTIGGTPPTSVAITMTGTNTAQGYIKTTATTLSLVVTNSTYALADYWRVGNGVWDIQTTANWYQATPVNAVTYINGTPVFLDDTASGPFPIIITNNVVVNPNAVTANNQAGHNYTITGSGSIAGSGTLSVAAGGTLTLTETNSYTGGTTVSSGQLNINNGGDTNDLDSAIGNGPLIINSGALDNTSGSNVVLQPIINETWNGNFTYVGSANSLNTGPGSVTLGQSLTVTVAGNDFIVGGIISDNGLNLGLTAQGPGILTLPSANSFGGGFVLIGAQLNLGNPQSTGPGSLLIDSGSIDNVSGGLLTLAPSSITWNGNFSYIGSTTNILDFGGDYIAFGNPVILNVVSNTMEIDGNVGVGNSGFTKIGAGTLIIGGTGNFGPSPSGSPNNSLEMVVQAGTVVFQRVLGYAIAASGYGGRGLIVESNAFVLDNGGGNAQLGHNNSASVPYTLETGGILDLYGNSEWVDSLVLNGGVLQNEDTNSSQASLSITNPAGVVTLEGKTNQINVGQTATLTINAAITGSGSYVMNGPGALILTGTNTYTGETTIQNGTIALSAGGTISGSTNIFLAGTNSALDLSQSTNYSVNNNPLLTLQSGQTLSGFGVVTGVVATVSGASVAPGSASSVGTLTVTGFNNDTNVLGGVALMKLNKAAVGQTNDQLVVQFGGLALGGTLALDNLSGTLKNGDSFTLFVAPGGISGSFAGITPYEPGPGLEWNTANLAVNGTISVITAPVPPYPPRITSASRSGTTMTLQGSNGVANGPYVVLESTNVTLPLAQWVPVLSTNFDSLGDFNISLTTTNPAEYFMISEP